MPPVIVMALLLDVALLTTRFRGAIVDLEDAFLKKVVEREILNVGIQLSMKAPICDGDFLIRLIERSISHNRELGLSCL